MAYNIDDLLNDLNREHQLRQGDYASEETAQKQIADEIERQAEALRQVGKELNDQQKFEIEKGIRARQRYQMANMELNQQATVNKRNIEYLQNKLQQQKIEEHMLKLQRQEANTEEQKAKINQQLKQLNQDQIKNEALIENYKQKQLRIDRHIAEGASQNATLSERIANAQKRANEYTEKQRENQRLHQQILRENQAIIEDTASTEEERAAARERIAREEEEHKERESSTLAQSGFSSAGVASSVSILGKILDVMGSIERQLTNAFTAAANFQAEYMAGVDARLQSEEAQTGFFKQITDDVQDQIGASRFVSQKELLQNVVRLTEQGVAYNLEQRALLATVSDKMVTTFNVLDDTLQRLIRVQQADLTMSQLGSEALLTKFLNSQFEDTSFLNQMYDNVLAALTDSISSMDKNAATSFTYAVEKWLASLYSVGLSDSAVTTIATGINALASGDISTLNGNQPLSVLMNMAATNAGLSYADILTQGLNANNVNDLMRAMVEYLATIADNTTENQVLRSQWSDVLGITLTDLRAVSNLTNNDISAIYSSRTNYEQSIQETKNQLQTVANRTSTAERVQNISENFMFDWGMNIAQNGAQYLTWYASQYVDSLLGTFGLQDSIIGNVTKIITALPALSSLSETLGDIADTSFAFNSSGGGILGVLASIGNILTLPFNLGSAIGSAVGNMFDTMAGNNQSLSGFYWDEYTMRGTDYSQGIRGVTDFVGGGGTSGGGFGHKDYSAVQQSYNEAVITGNTFGYQAPVIEGVSSSAYYNSTGSTTSTINNLVTNANNLANATSAVTGLTEEITTGASEIYKELFETQSTPIRVKLSELETSSFNQLNTLISQLDPEGVKFLLQQIQSLIPSTDNVSSMLQMMESVRRL